MGTKGDEYQRTGSSYVGVDMGVGWKQTCASCALICNM